MKWPPSYSHSFGVNGVDGAFGHATVSTCGNYCFRITREIGHESKVCTFILFNAVPAKDMENAPVIRRCVEFAKVWNAGSIDIVHLFAYRSEDPDALAAAANIAAMGPFNLEGAPHNHHYIEHSAMHAYQSKGPIVCVWGKRGRLYDQDRDTMRRIGRLKPSALKITRAGDPCDLKNLSKACALQPYTGTAA